MLGFYVYVLDKNRRDIFMNILFYFDRQINPERGGTERVTYNLAHYFQGKGNRVMYLAKHKVEEADASIKTFFLPDNGSVVSDENISWLENFLREEKIDFLINQGANGDDIYLLSHKALNTKTKIISVLHFSVYQGLNFFSAMQPLFLHRTPVALLSDFVRYIKMPYNKYKAYKQKKIRYRYLQDNMDAIVLLAPQYVDDMVKIGCLKDRRNLYVIPNPNSFELKDSVNWSEKKDEILFVGRLSYSEKRVDRLLKVWKKIYKYFPTLSLNIVGVGDDRNRLEQIAVKYKLERVFFRGYQSPEIYYRQAKMICLTSNHEGYPMVLIEGMQYGCVPIVFDSFGGASDLISNDKNGFLVKAFDISAYATTISNFIKNVNIQESMSMNAVSSSRKYDIEDISFLWQDLLTKIKN